MRPLRSATAMPSITTRIVARGGNVAKLVTASPTMKATPSWLTRLLAATTSSEPGAWALTPSDESSQLSAMTTIASIQNSQKGCGSLLPTRSIALNERNAARMTRDCGSAAVVVVDMLNLSEMRRAAGHASSADVDGEIVDVREQSWGE